jgi:hypothetical protein
LEVSTLDDLRVEDLRPVDLCDVGLGHAALSVVRVEDRGAVLLTDVGALTIARRPDRARSRRTP